MRLNHDICRCHNRACKERLNCLRWIERRQGGQWAVHCENMREDVPDEKPCPYRIRENSSAWEPLQCE